jgi:DNA topoisomerase VI subunit B
MNSSKPNRATVVRPTFSVSREMEFFTDKELSMQIGHSRELWPLALAKELIDNGMDACEKALERVAPKIEVHVEEDSISIKDNGPGIPTSTLEASLNYRTRTSDNLFFVSPSRGQLGNALKCVWAAPFVVDGRESLVEVSAGGVLHKIKVTLDQLSQQPRLERVPAKSVVKNGTLFKLHWPDVALLPGR